MSSLFVSPGVSRARTDAAYGSSALVKNKEYSAGGGRQAADAVRSQSGAGRTTRLVWRASMSRSTSGRSSSHMSALPSVRQARP